MADTEDVLTYARLEERSLRLANHFRSLGLESGDHVAIVAENRFEIVEALWAALRSGTLITAVNRHLTPDEASYIVHDCQAKVVLLSSGLEQADELAGLCAGCRPPHLDRPVHRGLRPVRGRARRRERCEAGLRAAR